MYETSFIIKHQQLSKAYNTLNGRGRVSLHTA